MKNLAIQVTYKTGDEVAEWLYPSTQVAFERRFDRGYLPAFADRQKLRMEWLLFVAHHALGISAPFDEWINSVMTVDVGEIETVPDGG